MKDKLTYILEINEPTIQGLRKLFLTGYNSSTHVCSKKCLPHSRLAEMAGLLEGGQAALIKAIIPKTLIFRTLKKVRLTKDKLINDFARKHGLNPKLTHQNVMLLLFASAIIGTDKVIETVDFNNSKAKSLKEYLQPNKDMLTDVIAEIGDGETSELVLAQLMNIIDTASDSDNSEASSMISGLFGMG